MTRFRTAVTALLLGTLIAPQGALAQAGKTLKREAEDKVDAQAKDIQVMVDQVFSYAEPGFQEVRTSAYLEDVLEKAGFTVTRGVAGIPTAFTATWGEGGPLIALGSDIDGLLGVSQYPGMAEAKAMVEGGPGHGEGHNAGLPLVIAAAIATKSVMEKHHIPGRLMIWPGVAEELLATKA
jgi:aminobenzoyl-glutamate utilization protein B